LGHLAKPIDTDVLCQGVANCRDSVATIARWFFPESVAPLIVQQAIAQVPEMDWKSQGRPHTDQPFGPLLKSLSHLCRK
jgi:hypothetical protein